MYNDTEIPQLMFDLLLMLLSRKYICTEFFSVQHLSTIQNSMKTIYYAWYAQKFFSRNSLDYKWALSTFNL